jgi:methyl-accepting chemotaxis protein
MTETTGTRFRTAVGGFHKGDVADYIAKTAAAHQAQLDELNKTIEALNEENEKLRSKLSSIDEALASADAAPELTAEAEPTEAGLYQQELAAYRRAEAAERLAGQRAKKLYECLDTICQGAEAQFDAADQAVQQAAEHILDQLQVLDDAKRQLSEALDASRQQIAALDAMSPDPAEVLEVAQ